MKAAFFRKPALLLHGLPKTLFPRMRTSIEHDAAWTVEKSRLTKIMH